MQALINTHLHDAGPATSVAEINHTSVAVVFSHDGEVTWIAP